MKRFKYLTLAALVAFGACDDGGDPIVDGNVTGTVSGQVTIEGVAASGVTVTLSSGATTTTDASGAYTFSGVEAGAYTVSISGFSADATFSATSKAATIATDDQVVTVNFDGSFVRTSAIIGSVRAGGDGLAGVTVSLGDQSTTTDADGQYSFSGLRAGTYTVTVSGFDATQYSFANASQEVDLGVGESQVVRFDGLLLTNATISGALYIDEQPRNTSFDAAESRLMVANVTVGLEVAIGDTIYTVTDANGNYAFPDLDAGTYKVILDTTDDDIPTNVAYGQAGNVALVALGAGQTQTVNWPFIIVTQRVEAAAFYGTDADVSLNPGPGINPAPGVTLDLYDTEANATAGGTVGRLDSATTGADGTVTFRFARSADRNPSSQTADAIVFARFRSVATPFKSLNGENIIEMKWAPGDSALIAPDTFDLLNSRVVMQFRAQTIRGDTLVGWNAAMYRNDTLMTATAIQSTDTNARGLATFTETTGPAAMPDTFHMRLSGAQSFANTLGHGWRQAPSADAPAFNNGRYLSLAHNGTQPDTVYLGEELVTFTDMHLLGYVHHERDDSTSIPTYTMGDNIENMDRVQVQLYSVSSTGALTSVGTTQPSIDSGAFAFLNVPLGTYRLRARGTFNNVDILQDTSLTVTIDGAWRDTTHAPLRGSAGPSTFAFKYNNTSLTGLVRAADGTNVNGASVRVQPTADNIQPNITDTTLTVTGGSWGINGLREGPYMITASLGDSTTVWELVTYTGSGNTSASMGTRDLQNNNDDDIVNFRAVRLDTEILGVVINDRDADLNTIDPDEALAGAVLELYKDNTGVQPVVSIDSLVATATTDAGGRFSFTGLREGRYIVKAQVGTPSAAVEVTRGIGVDTAVVATSAGTRIVGTHTPNPLPRWNYDTSHPDHGHLPANFTFLYKNGTAQGTITDAGTGAAIAGMTVSLRRCDDSFGSESPPNAVDPDGPDDIPGNADDVRCVSYLGTTSNTVTDAEGDFSFTGLIEGVYEVTPQPGTVGGYTSANPAARLYRIVGNGDVETGNFTVS